MVRVAGHYSAEYERLSTKSTFSVRRILRFPRAGRDEIAFNRLVAETSTWARRDGDFLRAQLRLVFLKIPRPYLRTFPSDEPGETAPRGRTCAFSRSRTTDIIRWWPRNWNLHIFLRALNDTTDTRNADVEFGLKICLGIHLASYYKYVSKCCANKWTPRTQNHRGQPSDDRVKISILSSTTIARIKISIPWIIKTTPGSFAFTQNNNSSRPNAVDYYV